jgi:MinD-like ATPase involved in chromosome partitioning or flagellar assembly
MPKVIAVHSYRGGTGKSNFTANLAAEVALQGYRVGVVDTDMPSPGIHNLFCLDAEDIGQTLNHYLWGEIAIEQAVYDVGKTLDLGSKGKLFFIPASIKADDIARILKDGYDVKVMNDGFRQFVQNFALDYLFIDTHPGLSKETFLSIAISHILLLLLRPDKQDYQGTAVTLDVVKQLKVRKLFLVINKSHRLLNPEALKEKVSTTYGETVAGLFPLSEDLVQMASEGIFSLKYPDHFISQEFKNVAQQILKG